MVRHGLRPIGSETVLQWGMALVIKWKNPATAKTELWIGVYIPEELSFGSPRRRATADVDPEDRGKYMMYLPGRNTCRSIDVKNIYPLSEYTPGDYEQDGHDYADVYERLYKIAKRIADIGYWTKLLKREKNFKDRNDKVPSIDFVPAGDDNAGGAQGTESDLEVGGNEDFSTMFPGDKEGSASVFSEGGPHNQMKQAKRILSEGSLLSSNKKVKTGNGGQDHRQQHKAPEPDGNEMVEIYVGNGNDQKIFHLSRNDIKKSCFMTGLIQGKFPYIMHPYLHQLSTAEFEPIFAFLSRQDDSDSDLLSLDGIDEEYILGDIDDQGKFWRIKGVHDIQELKAYILRLGPTYAQACSLGLSSMADNVIAKVQVAWNVYGRIDQLPLFLDFIESVIPNLAPQNSASGSGFGQLNISHSSYTPRSIEQPWIVKFLAETLVLYATEIPGRFWSLMDKFPTLRAAVFKYRGTLDDAVLRKLEKEFAQREPLTEDVFAIPDIPVKSEQTVEPTVEPAVEQTVEQAGEQAVEQQTIEQTIEQIVEQAVEAVAHEEKMGTSEANEAY